MVAHNGVSTGSTDALKVYWSFKPDQYFDRPVCNCQGNPNFAEPRIRPNSHQRLIAWEMTAPITYVEPKFGVRRTLHFSFGQLRTASRACTQPAQSSRVRPIMLVRNGKGRHPAVLQVHSPGNTRNRAVGCGVADATPTRSPPFLPSNQNQHPNPGRQHHERDGRDGEHRHSECPDNRDERLTERPADLHKDTEVSCRRVDGGEHARR